MKEKEKEDRREYHRMYYEDKREELSNKRKDLYKTDPGYRAKVKKTAELYRKRKKEEKAKLRAEGKLPPPRVRGPQKPVRLDNGAIAYPPMRVALMLGKSIDSLNHWERVGLLPKTPYRTSGGVRLYTGAMILVIDLAIKKRGRILQKDKTFFSEIVDGWEEIGVPAK